MKIKLLPRNSALSLLGAIIIFACIILIGVLIFNILVKAMENIPPPNNPGSFTNTLTSVSSAVFESVPAQVAMPAFNFSEQQLQSLDAEAFVERGSVLIERSTNLIDWEPAWRMSAMSEFNFALDTNGLTLPQCFYRVVLVQ